jgi:DNA-binding NarL/FixJ family response regulator
MKNVLRPKRVSEVLRACYALDGTLDAWLRSVARALAPDFNRELGVAAMVVELKPTTFLNVTPPQYFRMPTTVEAFMRTLNAAVPGQVVAKLSATAVEVASASQAFGADICDHFGEIGAPFRDTLGISVQDGEGRALQFSAPSQARCGIAPAAQSSWRKVAIHMGAAFRLRQRLSRGAQPEAIILDSKVVHAEGPAKAQSARALLLQAVLQLEQLRSSEPSRPEDALALCQGLVSGRWSLVDHFESLGKRYIAAFENIPNLATQNAAAPHLNVLQGFLRGLSIAEIAFANGLQTNTVQRVLSETARRVGMKNRADLLRLGEVRLMDRLDVPLGDAQLSVLRVDAPRLPPEAALRLTQAEQEVALLLLKGLSDGEIASERRTSARTVSHLLTSVYRKLNVRGRQDFVRRCLSAGA